jgi:hypothetical protein
MIAATHVIWQASGSPEPFDMDGVPIAKAKRGPSRCAMCGNEDGLYDLGELISSTFCPVRNENRLAGFGGKNYCAACVFCARSLRLRCIPWFASFEGIEFWRTRPDTPESPRPDALGRLLLPPKPPFVCGLPLYGIKHGGENHWQRTPWPGNLHPNDPLIRLQSKHVAIYARIAYSRDRYPVQVDDMLDFVLDRDLWLRLIDAANAVVHRCMDDGVPPYPSKLSLERLRIPSRVSPALAATWRTLTTPLQSYINAPWWRLFFELYPTPEDTRETKPNETTRRISKPRLFQEPTNSTPPTVVPIASDRSKDASGQDGKGSLQLALW